MPKIDLTVTVSVLIALCAIISPILTTIINNRHQTKIHKLNLEQKHFEDTVMYQRNIFEGYLKYAGKSISVDSRVSASEYGEYYLLALMYAPDEIQHDMTIIHRSIMDCDSENAAMMLEQLVPKIHTMLQNL